MVVPDIFPEADYFILSKELGRSALHFLAYRMRLMGAKDLEIYHELRQYTGDFVAANTTLRSRLGTPDDYPFPGFLVYYLGLNSYKELAKNHPDKELLMQNGKMRISDVHDGTYQKMLKAGLVTKEPKYTYDETTTIETINNFIRSQPSFQ